MIRSFRTIAKNEEITISYIDPTQCLEERQNALFTAYAFICQCHRCEKGPEDPGEILTGDPNLDAPITLVKVQLHALLDAMMNGSKEAKIAEKELQEIFDNPSNGKPWPINVHPIPNIHIMLAKEFEQEQQWERGLHYWLKIVHVIDPLRYPERLNPHRVNNLMSLCQLEGYVCYPRG